MLGKNCYEGGNKHKYIPRYTEKQIGELDEIECRGMGISEIRKLFIIKEYLL